MSVCLSVCLSVRLFTFEVPFKRLFAPTSRSRMSNIVRDSESLGKSNGKNWSQIWKILLESCLKSPRKKSLFWLILPYKRWWKPRFPMEPLVKGRIANLGISLDVFEFLSFKWFFRLKKIWFSGILGSPGNHASRWIRDLWSKGILLI